MNAVDDIAWEKPGTGGWTHDGAHSTGPVTPIMQGLFPSAMADGFRSFTGRYGLPISHIEMQYVNGYAYGSVRIAGVPPTDRPPPPAWLLRVLTRVHPEFRRRNRQALAAVEQRVWHTDLRRWFDELRPARLASLRALQAVDIGALTDAELADHVGACVAELSAGLREHFSLVGAAGLPVGMYVLREGERGRTAAEAIADLSGAASASTAATLPALRTVADALVAAEVEPTTLDEVRAASPAASAALDAYLADYGQRVVGAFDVTGRRLIEMPDLIIRSIASAQGRSAVDALAHSGDPVTDDVRLAVASRDDHAGISCMWPSGLLRRALLATGERLHAAGTLNDRMLVLEMTGDEVTAALRKSPSVPSTEALDARAQTRRRFAAIQPPASLGQIHPPPDPRVFPPGIRRMATAMAAFLSALETARAERVPADGQHGLGRGTGVGAVAHRGRAVVALDPEDAMDRLQPGNVLVTPTTTPAFNCVLPVAGALVTTHGGLMSHAGLAARELGIPAVVGLADAHLRIPDGAEVEVDPVAGTVRVV